MKFSLSRDELLKPLQMVAGVVERRQTLPVLSNVLISLQGNQLQITGTDLEVEILSKLSISDADDSGEITVPARKLLDIVKSLPESAEIDFYEENQRVIVKSGRSRFTLSTLPATEFPSVEQSEFNNQLIVSAPALKGMIDATGFAMAQQDVRYYLNGMLFELKEGGVRLVATDGHRLALSDAVAEVQAEDVKQAILPRKGVLELARLIGDRDDDLTLRLGSSHARIETDEFVFTSKLVDGKFPDYERVIPQGGTKEVFGSRDLLKGAFNRTAILSNEKYRGVRLGLVSGQLTIQANNPDQEEAQEEVAIDYEGEA